MARQQRQLESSFEWSNMVNARRVERGCIEMALSMTGTGGRLREVYPMSQAVCERVQIAPMLDRLLRFLQRILTVVYEPNSGVRAFLARAQTQETPLAQVTAAVLSAEESHEVFGVP